MFEQLEERAERAAMSSVTSVSSNPQAASNTYHDSVNSSRHISNSNFVTSNLYTPIFSSAQNAKNTSDVASASAILQVLMQQDKLKFRIQNYKII